MDTHDCRTLVFGSTSTVYASPTPSDHRSHPHRPIHPYAQSKLAVEQLLTALSRSGPWRMASLRYFNPVVAHPSGRIGEDPYGIPNNLFPFITQIAAGRRLITLVSDRPGHDRRYAIDPTLIRDELGWQPRHRFEQGLESTVRWFLENLDWCQAVQQSNG